MTFDMHGREVLDRRQCLNLLASVPLGRIVFTDRALPAIQPVNFVLDGDNVILRTSLGSAFPATADDTVVAFEADDFDTTHRTGWSVTVVGHAHIVHDPTEAARLARLPLRPWTPAPRDHFIQISCRHITGHRINRTTTEE
jgi:nitroimidazol reductase NimA-like FMN-containing flavoprotein (pyridoxamine 5'-phosphate oxidase superfamily)